MKNVVVIGSRQSGKKNNPNDIARHISNEETSVTRLFWEDLVISIETNNVRILSDNFDLLNSKVDLVIAVGWYKNGSKSIYRDLAFSVALALKHHDIAFWNSEMGQQRSTTKLSAMVQLALEGISVPKTWFSLDSDKLPELTYPYVAKAAAASRGASNFLVENDSQAKEFKESEGYFIIQPFLPNDHDLRVICFSGMPTLVLRRARHADANTHMNNTSQGGQADWIELDDLSPELLTFSEKVCKIMQREMAGIDLIPDDTSPVGYSCLEVNAVPQLTSGTDSDKKLTAFGEAVRDLQGNF
jgi:glutathione synthase/RimK-type ligase-like ATP-grasp enzyme